MSERAYTLPNLRISRCGEISFCAQQVGAALKSKLSISGYSLKKLADASGICERTLVRAIAGKPSKKIASYLGFVEVSK